MFPGGIGTSELLIIGALAVLLFGSKLPEVARNFGRSYQQFRKGLTDLQSSFTADANAPAKFDSRHEKIAHYKDAVDELETPPPPRAGTAKSGVGGEAADRLGCRGRLGKHSPAS
ncbi:MAG: twin-arginine translocase TatA/TatE family subunit [Blastopirellula sp.]|nr:twin-arginine translocase TatA/TatE family subunit [Blastopirellula sp.]